MTASSPQQAFETFNEAKGKQKLKELKPISTQLAEKLERNEEMMNKYGFYATPALVWKNAQEALETAYGLPKDLKSFFE